MDAGSNGACLSYMMQGKNQQGFMNQQGSNSIISLGVNNI
jgi:hypothetical protein